MTGVTFSRSYSYRRDYARCSKTIRGVGFAHRRRGRLGRTVARLVFRGALGSGAVHLAEHHTFLRKAEHWHVGSGVLDQNFFELTSYCGLYLKLIREAAA